MPLFMGMNTAVITFHLGEMGPSGLSLLQSLPRDFPGLRHVVISGISIDLMISDSLSTFFSGCKRLQSVDLDGPVSWRTVQSLAALIHLQTLTISISHHLPSPESTGFPSLQNLTLTDMAVEVTTAFVRTTASPLRHLSVYLTSGIARASELEDLAQTVHLHCLHLHLETIEIYASQMELGSFFNERMLRPLLVFVNLKKVELWVSCPFRVGNEMIKDISMAWPQLEVLVLGSFGWANSSQITLGGMIPLLCLTSLSELSIAIDTSIIDYTLDVESPIPSTPNVTLKYINLQASAINDPAPVAAFLSDFLPNLYAIDSWSPGATEHAGVPIATAEEYKNRWNEVARLVPIFAQVRRQERVRV